VRFTKGFLTTIFLLSLMIALNVFGYVTIKPSRRWGIFFGTTGSVKVDITDPGFAVRVIVPRPFLQGTVENDTSHVTSDISYDYFYYSLIDQSLHYPYDPNSPYTIEIWNPPQYFSPDCNGIFSNFTTPKYILLQKLTAPNIAGIYNFTVYIANIGPNNKPIFPLLPSKILPVPVSMREDPSYITGYIYDPMDAKVIKAKGVVYAIETTTRQVGRAFVNATTGFFNLTGLYAGEYQLEGSAAYFPGTGYAYAITKSAFTVRVGKGSGVALDKFLLLRGCTINGRITYTDQLNNPINPLDSPYLKALNYHGLNYTVEAYDSSGQIVASKTYESKNIPTEEFSLVLREGAVCVGYPANSTEYAGFGPETYTIRIWVYGFVLPQTQFKRAILSGYGTFVNVGESRLPYGGALSGKIRLFSPLTGTLETPKQGENMAFGSQTGKYFGGNVLIQVYSGGILRGLTVYNRTLPGGVVRYADYSSGDQTYLLRFYVLGFSEYYNHSYSGTWMIGSSPGPSPWDYGLEAGTYTIRLWIRGYSIAEVKDVTLGVGANTTVTVNAFRGGAAEVTINSYNVRPGTRTPQAAQTWRHLDMCPPPRIRVYFYNVSTGELGYAESILRLGLPGISATMATLNFTGHNWTTDEIVFQGYVPTTLNTGSYILKAYTYGYIQSREVTTYVFPGILSATSFILVIGCGINGNVPLMMNGILVSLTENTVMRPQVILDSYLKGVDVVNAGTGVSLFSFNTYGFYGRGHFFYVDEMGARWTDYGLDVGSPYKINVPVFGYDRKFYQSIQINVYLTELGGEVGVNFRMQRMIKIYGVVTGDTFTGVPPVRPLEWAKIAANSDATYTFDGDYALHLYPSGSVQVTYTIPGYKSVTILVTTNDQSEMNVNLAESGAPFP
jgi:hypothetical protein